MRNSAAIWLFTTLLVGCSAPVFGDDSGPATSAAPAAATNPQVQHWFGVAVENIPPAFARQLKLKPEQGLMVVAVMPNSPAERAGVRTDDILLAVNGAPLTSQEELARAANAAEGDRPRSSRIALLRDGSPASVTLTPGLRPARMLVLGNDVGSFVRQPQNAPAQVRQTDFRNYVLPNGVAAQVGPGYRVRLKGEDAGDGGAVTMKSIKSFVDRGQTIILSQETDASGAVRNTIVVGQVSYPVQAGKIDELPENLRPLAQQLLVTTPAQVQRSPATQQVAAGRPSLEERVKDLEQQNKELREQLTQLMDRLNKPAK